MNIKTYSFTKYIATLGAIFLFTAPLLGFLQSWKNIFNNNYSTEAVLTWIFEIIGILLIMGYLYIREKLKGKSGYQYTKKDRKNLNISFAMYGAAIILSFIYVIIACGTLGTIYNNDHRTGLMIAFAPIYVLLFVAAISAAIYESMSRVDEQAYLYQQADEAGKIREKNKDKSVSKTGAKRTSEAQKLLNQEELKSKKTKKEEPKDVEPIKTKGKETIDDQQALEDFFNTEDEDD